MADTVNTMLLRAHFSSSLSMNVCTAITCLQYNTVFVHSFPCIRIYGAYVCMCIR